MYDETKEGELIVSTHGQATPKPAQLPNLATPTYVQFHLMNYGATSLEFAQEPRTLSLLQENSRPPWGKANSREHENSK